jgi:hypothetical protein
MDNWQIFYKNIKDETWPDCPRVEDFFTLPRHIQEEIRNNHNCEFLDCFDDFEIIEYVTWDPGKSWIDDQRSIMPDEIFKIGDINVWYKSELNGGGTGFGQNFSKILKKLYPEKQFQNCLEWCSGPGFMGFRLLHDKICDQLSLFEAYQPVRSVLDKTIKGLPSRFVDKVRYKISNDIASLPVDSEFDLVIGNPPFYNHLTFANSYMDSRKSFDWDWKTHINFFNNISNYLAKDGIILLVESAHGSSPEDFKSIIVSNGLVITNSFAVGPIKDFYFMLIEKQK